MRMGRVVMLRSTCCSVAKTCRNVAKRVLKCCQGRVLMLRETCRNVAKQI